MGHDPWPTAVDVLLIEGDELVRACLGEVLADAGWRVAAAAGTGQALRMADTCAPPRVLVADLTPGRGMCGVAPVAVVRRRWPGLPAVLMTGGIADDPVLGPGERFLRKPFGADALVQAVAELAAGRVAAVHPSEVPVGAGPGSR